MNVCTVLRPCGCWVQPFLYAAVPDSRLLWAHMNIHLAASRAAAAVAGRSGATALSAALADGHSMLGCRYVRG